MKTERWHEVSRIFKSAISLDEESRARYLKEECAADESLLAEVERLIDSHRRARDEEFIGGAAVENVGALLLDPDENVPSEDSLVKGQTFGPYLIVDKLGAGGMGEVYLATDVRLDRTVALKILPSDVASDQRRMQRFCQEAKVASSLNQPNILTVFEFGTIDSLNFLATEYIDGVTLRDYLRDKQLKLPEVLNISTQILAALDAAHEAHIVHRDLKPENVMIRRRDEIVKVVDFGLAKMTEPKSSTTSSGPSNKEAPTQFKTQPGSVLGTVNYMSPEQAQGLPIDERTDLWSIGAMIYEMTAGTMPFKGPTTSHTIVQILEKDPPPLTQLDHIQVPGELQRIVDKALAKEQKERYHTARDMLIDVRNLMKRLQVEAEIERSTSRQLPAQQITASDNLTPSFGESRSNALSKRDRPRRKIILWGGFALVVLLAGAAFAITVLRARSKTPIAGALPVAEQRLTYWIQVQKYRDNKPYQNPFRLAGEINFEQNYRIRLNISSPQSGFLYVLNQGPVNTNEPPRFVVLFPSPTANDGNSHVNAGKEVQIPEQSWLVFDSEEGKETLWLVFSPKAIPELDAVTRFANPQARGLVNDVNLNRAVQTFLNAAAVGKSEVDKGENETKVTTKEAVLIYPLTFEHH